GDAAIKIDANIMRSTANMLADLSQSKRIFVGGLIVSWFWFNGIVVLSLMPTMVQGHLGGTEGVVTLSLAVFTVGIALGSYLAARASRRRPNLALVPIGALIIAVVCFDLTGLLWSGQAAAAQTLTVSSILSSWTSLRLLIDLALLAIGGGLFIVPAFAAVQSWAEPAKRARTIAGVNILNAAFMSVGTLSIFAAQIAGVDVALLVAILGALNVISVALILRAWGREGLQDLALFIFKQTLGLKVRGLENLPPAGTPAVLAPNHVSLLDAPLLFAAMPSHAAYAIDTMMSEKWWIKPFLRFVKWQSVDPTRPIGMRTLISQVRDGEQLVIFPEGRLTVTGGLMKVYDGTAMIADKAQAPIIPVRIDGPERSPFGYMTKSQTRKVWFPKTTLTILPPVALDLDDALKGRQRRQAAGARLQDIMVDAAVQTAPTKQTLFEALVRAKNTRDTGKPIVEDPLGTSLSYARLITGAQVLAGKLNARLGPSDNVGVLLPNAAGVAVTFFALQSLGRVAAMLNFTAGQRALEAACAAANIDTILTSRTFLEKARLEAIAEALSKRIRIIYLEDIKASVGVSDKLRGLARGTKPFAARKADDAAAILFTSGSEGTPKGVVLSHTNILSNAMQSLTRVAVNGEDKVFNVLPVFHSFGLTAGLVMPLVAGVPVFLYPSPLHYRIVPELVYQTNATILFGTDTFLTGYARAAHPYDFARVRLILAGAEAIKDRTRNIYMNKFGVRILEGYGVTETAPVLAINTPLANKAGTVGRLSPLMEARLEPVPGVHDAGRLYVRGPNVMLGYVRVERPGVLEPPEAGWHDTGDIVAIDQDGFITIKGRAKRFAKIAGEMVSLSAVEAAAAAIWPDKITIVVNVPDARKGERLFLLTTDKYIHRREFQAYAKANGISELSVPADIMVVDALPLLGSGKPDYVAANRLVHERLNGDGSIKAA
ncbi:MAG: acyl-[ACP]--phospholipid O-acyltransferase, partial [Pseudomonadota bacterium]